MRKKFNQRRTKRNQSIRHHNLRRNKKMMDGLLSVVTKILKRDDLSVLNNERNDLFKPFNCQFFRFEIEDLKIISSMKTKL